MIVSKTPEIRIADRLVGPAHPVYVIAEISANHNHSFDEAVRLVHVAKEAGADAVKLQTYTPDTITLDCDSEYFGTSGTIWAGRTLYELYGEAYMPWDWQGRLKDTAEELGLHCFSSPFDHTAVEFLESIDVPAYKIASFENVDIPLLRRVGATGKPVIISTGMATLAEIEEAVNAVRDGGGSQIALLKCTSAYPAPPEGMNLRTIAHLAQSFGVPAGLSDHTLGVSVPVAAVALGASIVEKHITMSRDVPGPDSAFSLEPEEFRVMVCAVREAEAAVGDVRYGASDQELQGLGFRRSLFVVEDIPAGAALTPGNVRSIRPGYGLHTRYLETVIGRRAARDIPRGTPLSWDLVSG